MWTKATPQAREIALRYARGGYQRGIIYGSESLSGSTLRGKAKEYSGRYRRSVINLLDRLIRAGLQVSEERGDHNKRILVINLPDPAQG